MRRPRSGSKPAGTKVFGVLICSATEDYNREDYRNPSEQILTSLTEFAHLNAAKIEVQLICPKECRLGHADFKSVQKLCIV